VSIILFFSIEIVHAIEDVATWSLVHS